MNRLFNRCLAEGVYPKRWKIANLVLIPKPERPPDETSSYRPICLLDGCGKLFEKLLVARMRLSLVGPNAITGNQYGFTSGRSTLDALARLKNLIDEASRRRQLLGMLTLDVKNAFNSAPWGWIVKACASKNLPGHLTRMVGAFLFERSIIAGTKLGSRFEMTCGVP